MGNMRVAGGQSNQVLQKSALFLLECCMRVSLVSASTTLLDLDMLPPTGIPISIDNPTKNVQLDQSSTRVYDCVQKLVSALDSRASLLADCGQLNVAMDDATAAISIAPTLSVGYLCAGRLFSGYGYHASAISVYDNGILHTPNSDHGYEQLLAAKATAQNKINRRIDFFSMLPLEIVLLNIIPRILRNQKVIHLERPSSYLDAHSAWCQRIAMADAFTFRVGHAEDPVSTCLTAMEYNRLLDMAPYIKSFIVWGAQNGMVDQLTRRTTFTALKELDIDGKRWDRIASAIYIDIYTFAGVYSRPFTKLWTLLHALGASLTQLTIDYGGWDKDGKPTQLCDYLDECPNLVALSISYDDFNPTSVSCTYPRLKKLDLIHVKMRMDMRTFLRPLPQLQLLSIIPAPRSSILPDIDQSCPLLQQLLLAKHFYQNRPDISDIREDSRLRVVTVTDPGKRKKFKGDDMLRYIVKHRDTIERIDIESRFVFSVPSTILHHESTLDIIFMRLRQIHYPAHAVECYMPFIVWLLQHAPQLESIQTVHGRLQEPVFEELMSGTHRHFKSIGLKANSRSQRNEQQFIQYHLNLGHQSNLEEIHIEIEEEPPSDSWILLIPQLTQLSHIEVRFGESPGTDGEGTRYGEVASFISNIASGCPGMKRFTLTAPTSEVHYTIFPTMAAHTNLKMLVITAHHLSGADSRLPSSIQGFQQLQVLHLTLYSLDAQVHTLLNTGSFQFIYNQKEHYFP